MTEPQVKKPTRKPGYLYCNTCKRTVPYAAMGVPELDMPFPLHRCGRDVRPFTGWREEKTA